MTKKSKTADQTPATAPVASPVIRITDKVAKLGGTRKTWYDALVAANGQTIDQFLAGDLPALPPKGSVKGRIRFFVREGLVVIA